MSGLWAIAFVLQWVMLLLLAIVLAGVLRFLASFQEKMQLAAPSTSRFELGERVDHFELPDLRGHLISSKDFLERNHRELLLLMTPTCGSCRDLALQIAELTTRPGGLEALTWPLVLVISGKRQEVESFAKDYPVLLSPAITMLVDEDATLLQQYGLTSVPTGIAVDNGGVVRHQSKNPHVNWLYKILDVKPPPQPVVQQQTLVTPAISSS